MEREELMTVNLKSITPIWTGNALGEMEDIKSSSVIGSIRWWYEIINRSLGKYICDATGVKGKCKLNGNDFLEEIYKGNTIDNALNKQEICSACKLFGCNGWGGKIKLIVDDNEGTNISKLEVGTRKSKFRRPVGGKMFQGENILKIKAYPVKKVTSEEVELLKLIIRLIAENAALGGRTSQGNGVVEIIPNEDNKKYNIRLDKKENLKNLEHPNLYNFFFLKFQLIFNKNISCIINENGFWTNNGKSNSRIWDTCWNKYSFIPIGFHIRDTIRRIKNGYSNKNLRHKLFGEMGKGSQIFVSHGYKINENTVEFRIWGYDREDKLNDLISDIENVIRDNLVNNLFAEEYNKKSNVVIDKLSELSGRQLLEKYLKEV